MFYKYNDVILSDLIGFEIKSVSISAIPSIENNSIVVFNRPGEIYNGSKKKVREINVEYAVYCDNVDDYEITKQDISDAFDVDSPKAFYNDNEEKFIYCILEGDLDFEDIVIRDEECYGEGSLKLIAYDPYFYNEEAKIYEGDKTLTYINEGKKTCPCVIDVHLENDANYIQINNEKGQAVLIGSYPSLEKTIVKEKSTDIDEECENKTNFITGSNVDANRVVIGGVDNCAINEGGFAIVASDFGEGEKWHGPCIRRNLVEGISDFEVSGEVYFDSTGRLEYNESCTTDKVSATKYKVTAKTISLKEQRSSSSKTLKTIKKDTYLYPDEVINGWIKTTYSGVTGWVKIANGLKKVTVTTANYYTNRAVSLRASGSKKSKLLMTVPSGSAVICYPNSVSGNYTKCKYNGVNGYIYTDYLTEGSDTTIETDEEIIIAENQLGLLEIYGYDLNNVKLFKFAICDDNEYYESAYPFVQVSNTDFLKDDGFSVPSPKKKTTVDGSDDKLTVKIETLNSGKYGNWNEFKGHFTIKRQGNKWYAEVIKYDSSGDIIKTLKSNTISNDDFPTTALNHIEVFFGKYADKEVITTMSLNRLKISKLNDTTQEDINVVSMNTGDTITIDTANNIVLKNNEMFMEHIDFGSEFFDLDVGENDLTIASDSTLISSVIFNERYNN